MIMMMTTDTLIEYLLRVWESVKWPIYIMSLSIYKTPLAIGIIIIPIL